MTMRYLMKGGYWKNSEDEILKAAVIKYGFNQWSRISSLIARKSAKQCKARWYEWLDPSIKKTEWTREEEEKLLHLAKIFPSQWRTIAPVVGRTPAQCVEHYERLLDQAQGRDGILENDPRKLKPGEIDPTPEIRPARADAKDMDDDEKEMIAEGRVRLANIKGKKAKRRAREKFIEKSRQMAQLQKQRELKAAGIDYIIEKKKKKKKVEIDYNVEIPFESRPVEIVYKTGDDENPKANPNIGNISLNTLEGPRRDAEEKKLRKLDQKRLKKLRNMDLPSHIDKLNKNNPLMYQKKTKLILQDPQLTDKDLELLAAMTESAAQFQTTSGFKATKNLVGNYSIREPTPVKTPRYSTGLMQEARNVLALSEAPSPMVGGNISGDIPEFIPNSQKRKKTSTPNPYKSILRKTPISSLRGETPLSGIMRKKTPRRTENSTPLMYNDELSLNNDDWADSAWEERMESEDEGPNGSRFFQIRDIIQRNLNNLPAPANEYQIELPELEEFKKKEAMLNESSMTLDAEEVERRAKKRMKQRRMKNILKRSKSVRMRLPRPFNLNKMYFKKLKGTSNDPRDVIEREMIQMIINDSVDFPLGKRSYDEMMMKNYRPGDDEFEVEELEKSEMMIEDEVRKILKERSLDEEKAEGIIENVYLEQFKEDWEKVKEKRFGKKMSKKVENEFEQLKKVNQKLGLVMEKLRDEIKDEEFDGELIKNSEDIERLKTEIKNKEIEVEVFTRLKDMERDAVIMRNHEMDIYLGDLRKKEKTLQRVYQSYKNKIEDLEREDRQEEDSN